MRRKLSQAVAILGALGALVAAGPLGQAAAAVPGPGQFALTPAPGASGQPRPYFTLAIDPGGSVRDTIVVSNIGSTAITLRLGTSDGITAAYSGSAYGPLATACREIGCWVADLPRTVTVGPHSEQDVPFRVTVPAGTAPSQYLAGISATPATAPKPVKLKLTQHSGTRVVIVQQVSVGVAVTVGQLARLRVKINIAGVTAGWIGTLVRLSVNLRNDGQRFTKGTGHITCQLDGTTHTYPIDMDTVLPGDTAALQVNGIGMHTGSWPCTIRIANSGGHVDTWAGTVVVPAETAAATKRIAENDYEVPPGDGIPGWAIVLMVLAGLILFSIWALILRRNHDKNLGNPSDT
ncbi:MAG TPA: hypothetical protein VIL16_25210 [Trebonia sp.]